MKNPIIDELKVDLVTAVTGTVDWKEAEAERSIELALHSIKDVLDREKDDDRSMLRLFSAARNTKGAVELHDTIDAVYMGRLVDDMGLLATQATEVKNAVLPVMLASLKKKANGDAVALKEALSTGSFGEMVENTTERLGEMAGSAKERIGDAAEKAREKMSGASEATKEKLGEVTEASKQKFEEVSEATKEKFGEVSEATKQKFDEVSEATKEKLSEATEVAKEKWTGIKKFFGKSKD